MGFEPDPEAWVQFVQVMGEYPIKARMQCRAGGLGRVRMCSTGGHVQRAEGGDLIRQMLIWAMGQQGAKAVDKPTRVERQKGVRFNRQGIQIDPCITSVAPYVPGDPSDVTCLVIQQIRITAVSTGQYGTIVAHMLRAIGIKGDQGAISIDDRPGVIRSRRAFGQGGKGCRQ